MHFRKALTSTGRRDKFSIQNNLAWESMEYEYQKEVPLETQRLSSCKGCNFWRFVLGFFLAWKEKGKQPMSYCPFFYQSYFISLFLDYDGLPKAHLIFHPKTREELKGSRRKNGVPYGVPIRILHPMNDKKDELLRLCIFLLSKVMLTLGS